MSATTQMLQTHPHKTRLELSLLGATIQACFESVQVSTACADACLSEPQVQMMLRCIRLDHDTADICLATGRMLLRQTEPDWVAMRAQLQACAAACRASGAEQPGHPFPFPKNA